MIADLVTFVVVCWAAAVHTGHSAVEEMLVAASRSAGDSFAEVATWRRYAQTALADLSLLPPAQGGARLPRREACVT